MTTLKSMYTKKVEIKKSYNEHCAEKKGKNRVVMACESFSSEKEKPRNIREKCKSPIITKTARWGGEHWCAAFLVLLYRGAERYKNAAMGLKSGKTRGRIRKRIKRYKNQEKRMKRRWESNIKELSHSFVFSPILLRLFFAFFSCPAHQWKTTTHVRGKPIAKKNTCDSSYHSSVL